MSDLKMMLQNLRDKSKCCKIDDFTGERYTIIHDMSIETLNMICDDGIEQLENAQTVNRWISVEDALPEIKEFHISDTVLCYCDSGALAIARLEANGFGQVGFNCEKDDEYHHSAGKVLYWMPIPEIPEPPEKE